jgi:hypothetical protein
VTEQIRYNAGKTRLSYFFASRTALERFLDLYVNDWDYGEPTLHSALRNISQFLAAGAGDLGWSYLTDAASELLYESECLVNPNPTIKLDGGPEFLCSCLGGLNAYVDVCIYGESKYARGNFRMGAPITSYLDSALRHLRAAIDGETYDVESSEPHAAMALWNVWQALDQPPFRDDRLPAVFGDVSWIPPEGGMTDAGW